ncbi:MAG: response regulator [bacterium]
MDDEKALANVLNLKLTNAGFETTVVYNGEDALTLLKAGSYDLALIDIMMPKRDGFSVLEELKKQGVATPVFALSNLGQEEDVAHVKALGAKEYIMKTDVSPADILGKVTAFLGMPAQTNATPLAAPETIAIQETPAPATQTEVEIPKPTEVEIPKAMMPAAEPTKTKPPLW